MIGAVTGLSVFSGTLALATTALAGVGDDDALAVRRVGNRPAPVRPGSTDEPPPASPGPVPGSAEAPEDDSLEISEAGLARDAAMAFRPAAPGDGVAGNEPGAGKTGATAAPAGEGEAAGAASQQLSEDEQQRVQDLQNRDREVRAHEAAHKATGGQYAGSASYSYEKGPDGRQYATSGEVPIDMSSGDDPQATISKMQRVRAAALAPANPSGADRQIAAKAAQAEAEARSEAMAARAGGTGSADDQEAGAEPTRVTAARRSSPFSAAQADWAEPTIDLYA
jgi:hypothetical protein